MDSLTQARADTSSYAASRRHDQTWIMPILYIGTFGSLIGYSFALPLVIKNTFPEFLADHPFIATYLAGLGFVGALVGSIARPFGGWLSDRLGGARVTLAVLVGMSVFTAGRSQVPSCLPDHGIPCEPAVLSLCVGSRTGSDRGYHPLRERSAVLPGAQPVPVIRRRSGSACDRCGARRPGPPRASVW